MSRLALALCLLALAGCDEMAAKPAARPKKDNFIVGKRTQEIKDAPKEVASGQAKVAARPAVARAPFPLAGNTYVYAIGKTAVDNIKHAVDLYHAETGDYPGTYDEFIEKIIKANNIALPQLPHYQKYSYDAAKHELIILEYPDLKENGPG